MQNYKLEKVLYIPLNNASSEAQVLRERFLQNRQQKIYVKQGATNPEDKQYRMKKTS